MERLGSFGNACGTFGNAHGTFNYVQECSWNVQVRSGMFMERLGTSMDVRERS
jgi:hypothetical protein